MMSIIRPGPHEVQEAATKVIPEALPTDQGEVIIPLKVAVLQEEDSILQDQEVRLQAPVLLPVVPEVHPHQVQAVQGDLHEVEEEIKK